MTTIHGRIHEGNKDFTKRMTAFSAVFTKAVGEELFPGTLNVQVREKLISGSTLEYPELKLMN
jgi:CTP-dependent riboflavin kinase